MNTLEQINSDLKDAMKSKDKVVLTTLRDVKAAITRFEKGGNVVDNLKVLDIVKKQAKQRDDSIKAFTEGKRWDLVDKERVEFDILSKYLPEQLDEASVNAVVVSIIEKLGATSMRDMGKVMGACKKELDGKADGGMVAKSVKTLLS
jgi:uncharacterized protein